MSTTMSSTLLRASSRSIQLRRCSFIHPRNHTRPFTSARPSLANGNLAAHPTSVLFTPSPQHIEAEDIDIDLIPPQDAKLDLTDRAAEVTPLSPPGCTETSSIYVSATSRNIRTRRQPRRCITNSSRVRRMSRIPVQNGTGCTARTR